jgi:hypothetical protein
VNLVSYEENGAQRRGMKGRTHKMRIRSRLRLADRHRAVGAVDFLATSGVSCFRSPGIEMRLMKITSLAHEGWDWRHPCINDLG